MAVQSDTSSITYTGNNSTTTSYTVPFVFLENSHLAAIAKVTATGVETPVTLVDHIGAGNSAGGNVRTAVAVPATSTLTIFRTVPATQTTSYQEGGDFPAASHERALDKLTMLSQQIARSISRTVRLSDAAPETEALAVLPNRFFGTDENGNIAMVAGTDAAAGSITEESLANGAVTTPKIADGAVTDVKLSDNAVGESKIASSAVTTSKIANAAVTPAKLSQPYTLATSVASTSGTAIDFTGIPSWARRIVVMFSGVSTNGSANIILQLGTVSGFVTNGYNGTATNPAASVYANNSVGFAISALNVASHVFFGQAIISNLDANIWTMLGQFGRSDAAGIHMSAGSLNVGGTLNRVRITTENGTDTFDAGTINISYEG